MIKFFSKKEVEKKENPVGKSLIIGSEITYSDQQAKTFVDEGYQKNIIIYRAIREIVTGIGSVELEVHQLKNSKVLENHKALDLLRRPNPTTSGATFLRNLFVDYLIYGEMALARFPMNGSKSPPTELWALNPSKIKIKEGVKGMPVKYIFDTGSKETEFPVNPINSSCDLFFLKMYDPKNYWRGQSPLKAAALAGDTHNSGLIWNYNLLKSGARPSGIVKFKNDPSIETISKLKEYFKRTLQGANNAGEIPVLTSEADWQEMNSSARDMDYVKTMKEVTKYIAMAYGVPLPLIDNDQSSFNNIEQSKERLWTDTIIPLLEEFLEAFSAWLLPAYGEGLVLKANLDKVQALESVRTRLFERMVKAVSSGLITIDEAREAIGYSKLGGNAEKLLVSASVTSLDSLDDMPLDDPLDGQL